MLQLVHSRTSKEKRALQLLLQNSKADPKQKQRYSGRELLGCAFTRHYSALLTLSLPLNQPHSDTIKQSNLRWPWIKPVAGSFSLTAHQLGSVLTQPRSLPSSRQARGGHCQRCPFHHSLPAATALGQLISQLTPAYLEKQHGDNLLSLLKMCLKYWPNTLLIFINVCLLCKNVSPA